MSAEKEKKVDKGKKAKKQEGIKSKAKLKKDEIKDNSSLNEKSGKKKKDKIKGDKKPKSRKKKVLIWSIVIVALIVIAFIPYYYTANPKSCTKCHSMDPYYKSWKVSDHGVNETGCDKCHVRPGWFPFLTYRIGFYREIFASIFDLELSPWGATAPGEASCTRMNCHSFNRLTSRTGELKVNHEKHYKKGKILCRTCHAGVTHPKVKGIGLQTPPRKQCFTCHKDEKKNCGFCHTSKYKPSTVPQSH